MIEKINELKNSTNSKEVEKFCENAISAISSAIYNGVTPEAKKEIENIALKNLFENLSNIEDQSIKDWVSNQKRLFTIRNLGVREAVNSLKENKELDEILIHFRDAIDKGIHESRLYEQFITALSPFGYFPTVGNAIQAVSDRVSKYKTDVDIVKILETMKETRSNYLVPLIEDVVNNYLSNKNKQTKNQLTETLMKFTYDPFVRDIASLLTLDATELQLEYANAQCDIDKVYSPILFLGENEAVFSVNKAYYIKKGNNVNRLPDVEVLKLDEEFKTLCETLANPNISINKNGLTIYYGNDKAFINEDGVLVNDKQMTNEEFKNAEEISKWKGNKGFYQLVEFLRSNYNEIAEVDFVKRVYLKEHENHSADVFKLRDNVFITTHNTEMGKSTFYRNINPIQAKNIMMEHLRYDVTKLVESLLPDEEKIMSQIKETKESYNSYISELQNKIEDFENKPFGKDVNEQVVDALKEELNEVKNEYKDYLNHVESYMRAPESIDEEITVDINVDGKKYTVPIPQEKTSKNSEDSEETGTEVGKDNIEDEPASAVTFDDDDTELLGDTPSIPDDQIDIGADEAEEDAEEAEAKEEEEELKADTEEEGDEIKIEDKADIDDEDKEELKDEDREKEKKKKEKKKKEEQLESSEGSGLKKKKYVKENGESIEEADDNPTKKKKVYLKRKVRESKKTIGNKLNEDHIKTKKGQIDYILKNTYDDGKDKAKYKKEDLEKKSDEDIEKIYLETEKNLKKKTKVNESQSTWNGGISNQTQQTVSQPQLGDDVMYDKQKGSVIGQIGNDLIVQVQGSSYRTNPKNVKVLGAKVETLKPPFKFSKETQELLFEQYVKCGIFMGDVPIKTSNCYVKYSDWNKSKNEDSVNVMVEGQNNILNKNQIKIFEDINDFANLDNYVEGVIIDETTEEPIESVQLNVVDYTEALGDAEPVRIIRGGNDVDPHTDTVPKGMLRTLSV